MRGNSVYHFRSASFIHRSSIEKAIGLDRATTLLRGGAILVRGASGSGAEFRTPRVVPGIAIATGKQTVPVSGSARAGIRPADIPPVAIDSGPLQQYSLPSRRSEVTRDRVGRAGGSRAVAKGPASELLLYTIGSSDRSAGIATLIR